MKKFREFLRNINPSTQLPKNDDVIHKCLSEFFIQMFGDDETTTPPVSIDWMNSIYMFDEFLGLIAKPKANESSELRCRFTKPLLHEGDSLPVVGNDNFLDFILEKSGDGQENEIAGDNGLRRTIRTLKNRHQDMIQTVKDYVANPSASNLGRLPSEIKDSARYLPDKSLYKDITDLLEYTFKHLGDPWALYFAAEEIAELCKNHDIKEEAWRNLDSFKAKLGVPTEILEQIDVKKRQLYNDYRSENRSSRVAADIIDEGASSDEGTETDAILADHSSISVATNKDRSGDTYIYDEEHPELFFTDAKHQKLNRLFTDKGIAQPEARLFSQDRPHGPETDRGKMQCGEFLSLDDFTIAKTLGSGSEGLVCAMYFKEISNAMLVAGKLMIVSNEQDYRDSFERSTKKWAELNGHPNIVQLLGFAHVEKLDGQTLEIGQGKILMLQIMEACVSNLDDVLEAKQNATKGATDYNETYCLSLVDILCDLLDGLAAMETFNIMHRDV